MMEKPGKVVEPDEPVLAVTLKVNPVYGSFWMANRQRDRFIDSSIHFGTLFRIIVLVFDKNLFCIIIMHFCYLFIVSFSLVLINQNLTPCVTLKS